ncbi:DUF6527 family protein [Sunxiuqinia indica]|uniref:DUF6527 family protein n=1 Tax=Sunxiuqinia indica TaxID=2692584 RepID=UPI0037424218
MKYKTAGHKCPCGCGNLVFTPLSPADWQLSYDGYGVTLTPSIGNWNYDCKSHYWIVNNKVRYASRWNDFEIDMVKKKELRDKKQYFKKRRKRNFRNWIYKILSLSCFV